VPNTAMSESISKRLAVLTLCGCGDSAHGGDINHQIDPLIHKGAVNPIQPAEKCVGKPMDTSPIGVNACTGDAGPAGSCPLADVRAEDHPRQGFRGDKCISVCAGVNVSNWRDPGQGTGNADLIALWILSLRNRFQDPDAEELWTILSAKWDGKGMNDTATVSEGKYSTYKLALFKLVARVLEKPLPEGVDEKLTQAQAASGGIRALYSRDGFFTLDQSGNTVTTSMVAIAYLAPATDF
jgi:hypothetical protein